MNPIVGPNTDTQNSGNIALLVVEVMALEGEDMVPHVLFHKAKTRVEM